MDPFVMDILLEVVKALVGIFTSVLIPALTIWLMYRTKRINDNAKKRDLKNEVNRLTQYVDQLQSFRNVDIGERKEAIMESVRLFALENNIVVSEAEMEMMVEQSLQSLRRLINTGHKLGKLKQEAQDGKTIKE
jgi:hypothetical protein